MLKTGKKNWKDLAVTNGQIVDMCLGNIGYKKVFVAKGGNSGELKTGVSEVGKDRTVRSIMIRRILKGRRFPKTAR